MWESEQGSQMKQYPQRSRRWAPGNAAPHRQMAEIVRVERCGCVGFPTDTFVFFMKSEPRMLRHRYIGGNTTMELMERFFSQQNHLFEV